MGTFRTSLRFPPTVAEVAREANTASERPRRAIGGMLAVLAVSLALVLGIQAFHGAYTAPVADFPDEPAHVVTSLMYRQFLLAPTGDPLQFAKSYYSHYPSMAAGHWPPVLHLSAAVWMIFTGAGKAQLIFFIALFAALTAALLYRSLLTVGSAGLAAGFLAIWMTLAQSQSAFTRFMTEAPLTLLTLAAVVAYIRYLREPSYRLAVLFALLSSAAILTKETAVALALVPLAAVAAARRWELLRKGHFWLPAPLVVALVAPWHLWIAAIGVGRYRQGAVERLLLNPGSGPAERLELFGELLGWPLALLAVLGLSVWLYRAGREPDSSSIFGAHAGLLAGGLAVLFLAPEAKEVRHLYQLTPSLILFAAAGAWSVTKALHGSSRTAGAVLVGVCCVLISPARFARPEKAVAASSGPTGVARYLNSAPEAQTVLVFTSGGVSEGPLIAEMALLEPDAHRYLVRSSKTIYGMNWDGAAYRPLITTAPELENFIDSSGLDAVVWIDGPSERRRPDEAMLSRAIVERPQVWEPIEIDSADHARVFRRVAPNSTAPQPIRIQMASRLGHDIVIENDAPVLP